MVAVGSPPVAHATPRSSLEQATQLLKLTQPFTTQSGMLVCYRIAQLLHPRARGAFNGVSAP